MFVGNRNSIFDFPIETTQFEIIDHTSSINLNHKNTVGKAKQEDTDHILNPTQEMRKGRPKTKPRTKQTSGRHNFSMSGGNFPTLEEAYPEVYDREDIIDLQLDAAAIDARVQCPISLEFFRDPVLAMDGHHYEAHIIKMWMVVSLSQGTELLSPLTNEPMGNKLVRDPEKRLQTLHFIEKHGMRLGPLPDSQTLPDEYREKAMQIGSRNAIRIRLSEMQKGGQQAQAPSVLPSEVNDSFDALRLEKKMKDRNEVLDASFKLEKLLFLAEEKGLWKKTDMSRGGSDRGFNSSAMGGKRMRENTRDIREGVGAMLNAIVYQANLTLHDNRKQDLWYCIQWRNKLVHYDPQNPARESFDSEATKSFAKRFRDGYDALYTAIQTRLSIDLEAEAATEEDRMVTRRVKFKVTQDFARGEKMTLNIEGSRGGVECNYKVLHSFTKDVAACSDYTCDVSVPSGMIGPWIDRTEQDEEAERLKVELSREDRTGQRSETSSGRFEISSVAVDDSDNESNNETEGVSIRQPTSGGGGNRQRTDLHDPWKDVAKKVKYRLKDLQAKKKYNGHTGTLVKWNAKRERFVFLFDADPWPKDTKILVKSSNMEKVVVESTKQTKMKTKAKKKKKKKKKRKR